MSKKRHRLPPFRTHYLTDAGILMILSQNWYMLVRMSDGYSKLFTYED